MLPPYYEISVAGTCRDAHPTLPTQLSYDTLISGDTWVCMSRRGIDPHEPEAAQIAYTILSHGVLTRGSQLGGCSASNGSPDCGAAALYRSYAWDAW